jgi:ERCC4-type nuclease
MRIIKRTNSDTRGIVWPVVVYVDDREKTPFELDKYYFTVVKKRLKSGDYAIEGIEDIVCIERKNSINEILTDLSKKYRDNFKACLLRIKLFKEKVMIIEEDLSSINRKLATSRSSMTAQGLFNWLARIGIEYGIKLFFVTDKKFYKNSFVNEIFKEIVKTHYKRNVR